ncbi:MAG: AAA domain-containing protein [Candidatus Sericytochromatia bacterium]
MFKNQSLELEIVSKKEDNFNTDSFASIFIAKRNFIQYELVLKDLWTDLSDRLWSGAIVLIHFFSEEGKTITVDKRSYLVLEPDVLVSPSQIRSAEGCIRKYYVDKRIGTSDKNFNMLRGSLINNAFDILIEGKKLTKNEIIEKVIKDAFIDLISLEEEDLPEYEKIKAILDKNITSLLLWKTHKKFAESQNVSIEPSFISRKYGLSGRLDLLVNPGKEAVTYELKTGKAPNDQPWNNDKYQVASYQLLLESAYGCVNPESYLIYSQGTANNLLREGNIKPELRREIINIRNKIVSIDYALVNDYSDENIKKLIPLTETGNCLKCLKKNDCFEICGKFGEKNCSSCGVKDFCTSSDKNISSFTFDYYNRYFQMIEKERNESRKSFSRIFSNKEVLELEGKAIINLNYSGKKDRVLKLNSPSTIESEIKKGDIVLLYNNEIVFEEIFKASVYYIDTNNIYLKMKKDIDENLFSEKTWSIYKDTMETTFDTMQGALYNLLREENKNILELISGLKKPRFSKIPNLTLDNSLNERQKEAILKALSCKDYFLIQGPPGTGKTHTLANLIIEAVKMGKKVLLSAFTHRAIDNVLIKLVENNFTDFVRIGSHDTVDNTLHKYLLQDKVEYFSFDEMKKAQSYLKEIPVIACSSIYATSSSLIKRLNFDYSVVDEAGQLTEPGTISIILNSKKFILVGDHKQLPPIVQNEESKKLKYDKSLFERLIHLNLDSLDKVLVTLEEQYRMNEKIMDYSNINFYDFCLKAYKDIATQKINLTKPFDTSIYKDILDPDKPMVFVDHKSSGNLKLNPKEAFLIFNIVNEFINFGIDVEKIGIITPFRAQVAEIRRAFLSHKNSDQYSKITIDTVDRFQGSDRDIIIFSSVATDSEHITDFFTDFRRINVTVTRAKKKFILVGNKPILSESELFYKLIRLSNYTSFIYSY